jgi:hypothetical protein
MEAADGSMGCAVGLAGFHQVAAVAVETVVVEDVPLELVLAGLAVAVPSSVASFAAARDKRIYNELDILAPNSKFAPLSQPNFHEFVSYRTFPHKLKENI